MAGPLARQKDLPVAPAAACERSERKPGRTWGAAAPPLCSLAVSPACRRASCDFSGTVNRYPKLAPKFVSSGYELRSNGFFSYCIGIDTIGSLSGASSPGSSSVDDSNGSRNSASSACDTA